MNYQLKDLFLKGGGFMWPILILSIISVIVILERVVFYIVNRYRVGTAIAQLRNQTAASHFSTPLSKDAPSAMEDVPQGVDHCLNVS